MLKFSLKWPVGPIQSVSRDVREPTVHIGELAGGGSVAVVVGFCGR